MALTKGYKIITKSIVIFKFSRTLLKKKEQSTFQYFIRKNNGNKKKETMEIKINLQ